MLGETLDVLGERRMFAPANPLKGSPTGLFISGDAAAAAVMGTPVPVSQPTSKPYTDPATGATWRFNGIAWVKVTPSPVVKK